MLTDVKIRQAKPREKAYKLYDAGGLYLTITPNGARSWRYDYRLAGVRKTLTIGLYPAVTLADARECHVEARRLVARGICPALSKQKGRKAAVESAANTVRALGESWFTELAEHRSATWRENARRWLDDRIYPDLGSRPADSVESYNAAEYLPERRKMLQWWADYLDGLRAGGNVVAFKRPA
jgi:hypothetical protein